MGRLMSVASRRGRPVAVWCLISFFRLVSRFARRLVPRPRLVLRIAIRGGKTDRVGRGGDAIVIMRSGRRCSCSRISDWLGGSIGTRRFIQLVFSYSHSRGSISCSWRDGIDMG